MNLLKLQRLVAEEHHRSTIFLEGDAGTGKTTAAIERVKNLIRDGVSPESILILVPQARLAMPYQDALRRARTIKGATVHSTTMSGLAVHMIDLFWPLIAEDIGFEKPLERPHFLSLELVQYYMARFLEPEIRRNDYFNSVHISRNRLYTQIVDNLDKAALVGFSYQEIADRLKSAWRGDVEQSYIYDDAQACAILFRELCRSNNLLDFSLQINLFVDHIWTMEAPRNYLTRKYRHLIVDNIEEDNPAAHDLLSDWLKTCESALVIYDTDGGNRHFLGADPKDAYRLKDQCKEHVKLDNPRVMSPELIAFQTEFARSLHHADTRKPKADARNAIVYADNRYVPQMVDWTVDNVVRLVNDEGVPPGEIVILSALLPDALRFSLQTRLNERGIPNRAHRPSRALRDEPAARTLIALAKLAHPGWKNAPNPFDLAFALTATIGDLDLVRSRLLTDSLFVSDRLLPFSELQDPKLQTRITFDLGTRYEVLRSWIDRYQQSDPLPLDVFFSKLFGEVLSQPGFGFHQNFDAANTAANLIDSAQEFRQTVSRIEPNLPVAQEYILMVDTGVLANQYIRERSKNERDAVLIAPAYSFLMDNRPVDYQFWLNVGSTSWDQRLMQPLTHPYVLSRQWQVGQVWTDEDEVKNSQQALYQVMSGLIRRCRKQVYLGFSQYGDQGYEQRGAVLMAVQSMLRRLAKEEANV